MRLLGVVARDTLHRACSRLIKGVLVGLASESSQNFSLTIQRQNWASLNELKTAVSQLSVAKHHSPIINDPSLVCNVPTVALYHQPAIASAKNAGQRLSQTVPCQTLHADVKNAELNPKRSMLTDTVLTAASATQRENLTELW